MNRIKWIAVAVALAVLVYLGWSNVRTLRGDVTGGDAPQVFTMPVMRGVLTDRVVAPASLSAADSTELRAPFTAPRIRISVAVGDTVARDDILAVLETDELMSEIRRAEAAVLAARADLDNALRQAVIGPREAERQLRQAEKRVTDAEAAVADAARTGDAAIGQARADLARAEAALSLGSDGADLTAARAAAEAALQQMAASPGDPALVQAYQDALQRYQELEAKAVTDAAAAQQEVARLRTALSKAQADRGAAVEQAEASLDQARFDLDKLRLQQGGSTGTDPVEAARQALAGAEQALAALQRKLDEATVRAPLDGVVLAVEALDGQAVTAGAKLATVGRLDQMEVQLRVDEQDVNKLAVGQSLQLRAQAFPGDMFEGTITHIPLQAGTGQDPGYYGPGMGGSQFFLTGLVQNPETRLRIGMNAEAEIVTLHREGVVLIGLEAMRQDNGPHVFVLDGDTARRRDVIPGATSRTEIEIVEGLTEGDIIIIGPFPVVKELKDGQKVTSDRPAGEGPGMMPGGGPGMEPPMGEPPVGEPIEMPTGEAPRG